jgi:2'-5' RNA ligase
VPIAGLDKRRTGIDHTYMGQEQRLFTGIELPRAWLDAASAMRRALLWHDVDARFTPPDRLHMTVHFIGETREGRAIENAMATLTSCAPFELAVKGAGRFQRRRGGDLIVWHVQGDDALSAYHRREREALASVGLSFDRRPYTPHITIARNARGSFLGSGGLPGTLTVPPPFRVDVVTLFWSHRVDGRLVYTPLRRIRLNG